MSMRKQPNPPPDFQRPPPPPAPPKASQPVTADAAEVLGSDLFFRVIKYFDQGTKRDNLTRKVWSGTPWMVDTFTGPIDNYGRYREIMDWCRENFGDEAWPIHGKEGDWHSGGATVHGWTWMGFKTKEMMDLFVERWGER